MATTLPASPARLDLLDGFRFLAALAIIGIHSLHLKEVLPLAEAMRFSVPFFTAATTFCCFLLVEKERSFKDFFKNRCTRILLIFLIWELLYFSIRIACKILFQEETLLLLPWKGQAYHMWYLPFIFAWSLVCWTFAKLSLRSEWMRSVVMLGAAFVGLGLVCYPQILTVYWPANENLHALSPFSKNVTHTLLYWLWDMLLTLPAGLFTVSICAYRSSPGRKTLLHNLSAKNSWLGFMLLFFATWYQVAFHRNYAAENLTGVGMLLIGLGHLNPRCPVWFSALGKHAYGIYLVHLIFTGSLASLAARYLSITTEKTELAIFVIAILSCTLFVQQSSKTKLGQFLMGD